MKKKILSLTLVVCLLAIAVVGGTLAYFTDTDKADNVMAVGVLDIVQIENFVKPDYLVPGVYESATDDPYWNAPTDLSAIENKVTKEVYVQNNGNVPAYARTLFAFEDTNDMTNYLHYTSEGENLITNDGLLEFPGVYIYIDDVRYCIGVYYYKDAVAPFGGQTEMSLKSIFWDKATTNEVLANAGSEYTIVALSQAVQTEGFGEGANVYALNEAFGEITAVNAAEWFGGTVTVTP